MFTGQQNHWIPDEPIETFFFDFDGTLSLIEGIDELARMNGVGEQVRDITQRCMSTTGLSLSEYKERLEYVKPTTSQQEQLATMYKEHQTVGALETIQLLRSLGKNIYIISAGIKSTLLPLAKDLGIPPEHVFAVDVYNDNDGNYLGFNEQSYLVQPEGKNRQVVEILKNNERSLLLGDGYSDWEARMVVSRFVGFSGLSPKKWVRDNSKFYIANTNIYPIINLGLTHEEQMNLMSCSFHMTYFEQGLSDINNGLVFIKE